MGHYINYPQPEKFPLAVKILMDEPEQEQIKEDSFRKHEYSELIIVYSGTAEHRIGNRCVKIKADDVLVIHPGIENQFSNLEDFRLLTVIFDSSVLPPVFNGANLPFVAQLFPGDSKVDCLNPVTRIPTYDRGLCENLIRRLSYETHRERIGRNIMIPLLFTELIIYLARGDSMKIEKEELWRIQSPAEYLNLHYQEPLNLKKLERLAGMSERSLFRHFQHTLGMSPNKYLHKVRIQKACELLTESQKSIGEIALLCGFCDSNHLAKIFHSVTGTTPFAFRRKLQEKNADL